MNVNDLKFFYFFNNKIFNSSFYERILKNENLDSDSENDYEEIDEKTERKFNLDERLRIAHLQSPRYNTKI